MSLTVFPPPSAIAGWPRPNLVNPERHGLGLLILCFTLGPLSVLLPFGRLWTRFIIQRNAGIDDYLLAIGLIPLGALLVIISLMSKLYGFDKHMWDNPVSLYVPERRLAFAAEMSYLLATCLIKSSILLFYQRIPSRTISPTFLFITKVSLASVVLATVAFLIALFRACRSLFSFWFTNDQTTQMRGAGFGCSDEFNILLSAFIVTTVQDFIVTTLPLLLFWKVEMSSQEKKLLGAVFAVGYLVCLLSIARLYYIYLLFYVTFDTTWTSWYIWIWKVFEITMGAMCASAPTLPALYRHYWGALSCDRPPPVPPKPPHMIGVRRSVFQFHGSPSSSFAQLTYPHRVRYSVHVYAEEGRDDRPLV